MRRIYRNLDAFIFVSDLARNRFLSRWPRGHVPFSQSAMQTLHPSLDCTQQLSYSPPAEKGPFTLLYLGRLSPEKGIERLIGAMRLLKGKRVRLAIAGTGYADYVDSLQRLAVRHGVSNLIDWKGWNDNPLQAISDCHAGICVSPREEPFSLASLETMASGRVQIIPPDGAFAEYLSPVSIGEVEIDAVPEKADSLRLGALTEEAIAEAVLALASRRELCAAMGRAAFDNYCRRPSAKATMERLRDLYLGV